MSDLYTSNQVPHSVPGGEMELFDETGASQGPYVLEAFNPQRPVITVDRPNEVGADGGWAATGYGIATGATTVQVATQSTPWPKAGWYFDGNFGFGNERWVFLEIGQPYAAADYWKASVTMRLDRYATLS